MQGVTSITPGGVTASPAPLSLSAASSTRRADSLGLKSSLLGSKGVLLRDLAASPRKSYKVDDHEAGAKGAPFQVRATATPQKSSGLESLLKGIIKVPPSKAKTVVYEGIAKIAKKRVRLTNLVQSDLVDFDAAAKDKAAELLGKKIQIQLVSVDLDAGTKQPKLSTTSTVEGWVTNTGDFDLVADEDDYSITFSVPTDFGEIGAFVIKNYHPTEFFLKNLILQGPKDTRVVFNSLAWVHPHERYPKDRVFFTSKGYLPSATPPGLVALRQQELEQTRGDGKGRRQPWDRIYDYDVYNDIGQPDKDVALTRPVLGGSKDLPYPRRIRTGRPMSKKDPKSEERLPLPIEIPYIPSDEFFLRTKNSTFVAATIKGFAHSILPAIDSVLTGKDFSSYEDLNDLYKNGLPIRVPESILSSDLTPEADAQKGSFVWINDIFHAKGQSTSIVVYPTPEEIKHNPTAWETDEEYGRQTLAGLNPGVIQLLKAYPPESALDPQQYGQGTSLKDEHILPYLEGLSVSQAIKAKKLFTIDYHDAILPFVERANADTKAGFKCYAPRTIFFYDSKGKIKPVAIELSLPPKSKGGKSTHRVLTPADAPDHLWTLAKLHAGSIDSAYHQVIAHFGNTHAAMEPFIIATNRQLSEMHPIRTLLQPHFKDTMNINAGAREALIHAGGVIETAFSTGQYSMQVGSKAYGSSWRFDTMGPPQSLLSRGLAEPADESHPGSVKLLVEDYPWAKDALELWDALYKWVEKYCDIVYNGSDEAVNTDKEIQAWWNEIVNVGHGDHKDAPWWPKPDSIKSLAFIVTTMGWIAGPMHASVNFGQFAYSGYPLNKPTGTRKFIPEKNSPEYAELQKNPEKFFLSSITSSSQVTSVLTIIELLSTHSVDEEYVGVQSMSTDWSANPKISAAFREFSNRVATLADNIKQRNNDKSLINRSGPAQVPYTLLYPTSTSGLTGRGVPYSTSI